jgi:hypothetical protein
VNTPASHELNRQKSHPFSIVTQHVAVCCASQVSHIPKWQPKGVALDTHTAINTEWGRYSSTVLPRVQEDLDLDAETGSLQGTCGL